MGYRWLADAVVLLHFGFVLFVALGGFLVIRWRKLAWLHVPSALWGAVIELTGGVCPLTPLEQYLRRLGGEAGYRGGFIEHYITSIIYPQGLSRGIQIGLGVAVLVVNLVAYTLVVRRRRMR